MLRKLTTLAAAGVLSLGLSSAANADFISGTIGFSGSLPFASLGDVVSDITLFTPQDPTGASVGTGDFAGSTPAPATTGPIDINAPGGTIFEVDGFTFELLSVSGVLTDPLACNPLGLCTDEIRFLMTGVVSAAGFDDTLWNGNFTANGTCLQEGDACADDGKSATWSSTIVALDREVPMPIPGTLLLVGLGLLGAHTVRRRAA
jgi:hypothetical protein